MYKRQVPNTGAGTEGSASVPDTAGLGAGNRVFAVHGPTHRRALAAGQSITIPVTFTPRTSGTVVADVTVSGTAGSGTL